MPFMRLWKITLPVTIEPLIWLRKLFTMGFLLYPWHLIVGLIPRNSSKRLKLLDVNLLASWRDLVWPETTQIQERLEKGWVFGLRPFSEFDFHKLNFRSAKKNVARSLAAKHYLSKISTYHWQSSQFITVSMAQRHLPFMQRLTLQWLGQSFGDFRVLDGQ